MVGVTLITVTEVRVQHGHDETTTSLDALGADGLSVS